MKKRETARSLFLFVVCLNMFGRHTTSWVLCAFFMVIAKLLKTNRIHKTACEVYKMLIYNISIV